MFIRGFGGEKGKRYEDLGMRHGNAMEMSDLEDEDGLVVVGWGLLERVGRRIGLGWLAEKGARAKQGATRIVSSVSHERLRRSRVWQIIVLLCLEIGRAHV